MSRARHGSSGRGKARAPVPPSVPVPPSAPAGDASHHPEPGLTAPTSTGLSPRVAAVLSYSAWWLTGALFLLIEPVHPFVRHHARQALLVFGALFAAGVALWAFTFVAVFVSPGVFRTTVFLAGVTWAVALALWVTSLVQAWRGRFWGVGSIAGWMKTRGWGA